MGSTTFKAIFDGDVSGLNRATGEAQGHLSKMGSALGEVSKIAGGFVLGAGILKAPGFLMDAARAAAEDEQSTARLTATLKTLGGSYDSNLAKVNAAIKSGQALAFSDDDVRDSFDKLAQATGDTDDALARQSIAMDLARGAHIPLADASKLLGKVTDENLQVFKRMGITLPDVANEADVLAAVQAKFAGQADGYAKSTAGQFEQTGIRMGELKEAIGAQLLPIMARIGQVLVDDVIPKLEEFADWWAANAQPKIEEFIAWVMPKLKQIGEFIRDEVMPVVKEQFAQFEIYYKENIEPVVANIIALFLSIVEWFRQHWPEIWAIVQPVILQIKNYIQTSVTVILDVINLISALLRGDWSAAWEQVKKLVTDIWEGFKDSVNNFKNFLDGMVTPFAAVGSAIGNAIGGGISAAIGSAVSTATNLINQLISAYNNTLGRIPGAPSIPQLGGGGGSRGVDYGTSASRAATDAELYPNGHPIYGPDVPPFGADGGGSFTGGPIGSFAPLMAAGGIVRRPTLAYVGEAGPEVVVPLSRAGEFGLGGGSPVIINVTVTDVDSFMRTADQRLRRMGRPTVFGTTG